jgi:hypothetical protein
VKAVREVRAVRNMRVVRVVRVRTSTIACASPRSSPSTVVVVTVVVMVVPKEEGETEENEEVVEAGTSLVASVASATIQYPATAMSSIYISLSSTYSSVKTAPPPPPPPPFELLPSNEVLPSAITVLEAAGKGLGGEAGTTKENLNFVMLLQCCRSLLAELLHYWGGVRSAQQIRT